MVAADPHPELRYELTPTGRKARGQDLTQQANPTTVGDIKWNFTKFLVDRNGRVVARFESPVRPDSPEVVEAIEKLLKQ